MRAEILAFGTEILMGETQDTNSAHIAARLPALGVELHTVTVMADEVDEMVATLHRGMARSDVIICTGGLGPTKDDITREAIAEAFGETIEVDPDLVADMERYFKGRGMEMPESNVKQATRIPSVTILPNPRGTAPGWWAEKNGTIIIAMPGVPSEMVVMWEQQAAPRLKERSQGTVILSRTFKTIGLGEATVGEQVGSLFGHENPYLGIYARQDGIHLRIISKAPTEQEARALMEPMEAEIFSVLGPSIWGVDDETPEERVGTLLQQKGLTMAAMESCTGGLLASVVTDVPGSSAYFKGSLVTYATEVKSIAGVDADLIKKHGVVSSEVAEAMAEAVRGGLNADVGIGITGVAGPGPSEGIAAGTVYVGVSLNGITQSTEMRFPPDRPLVKRRAVVQALLLVYRLLLERQG
jgi:nicotinamide-nucleotide amidase